MDQSAVVTDQNSLTKRQIDAGNRFLREFDKFAPVVVAFWARESDSGSWAFYIVCERDEGLESYVEAFRKIAQIAAGIRDPDFNPLQVRLPPKSDPLVQAALVACRNRPPKIPFGIHGLFKGWADEAYFVQGPTRRFSMPTGLDTLTEIIDKEAEFFQQYGRAPKKAKLPVLMAYDLAKCGRQELGDVAGRIFKEGIDVLEKEGFHGMSVEIVRKPDAVLEFE